MKFVIVHPEYKYYAEHENTPRFVKHLGYRQKRAMRRRAKEFDSMAEAREFMDDREANPGLEECVIEPRGLGLADK